MDLTQIDPDDRETVARTFRIAEAMAAEIMYVNDDDVDDFVLEKLRYAVRFADGKAGFVCSGTRARTQRKPDGCECAHGLRITSSEAKSDGRFCQSTKRRERRP